MVSSAEQEPAAPGTGARPTVEHGAVPEAEVGSTVDGGPADRGDDGTRDRDDGRTASDEIQGGPAADVGATGTALKPGERNSGLDLDDAPGATGPGAG